MFKNSSYSDKSLQRLKELVIENKRDWKKIRDAWNGEFSLTHGFKTIEALRKTHKRYEEDDFNDDTLLKNLQTAFTAKKRSNQLSRENKLLLENTTSLEDVLSGIEEAIGKIKCIKYAPKKILKQKNKKTEMIIEALISDVHYGLKTKTFNLDVARKRIQKYTNTFIDEIERNTKNFNIKKALIQLNGDIIQSATMHKGSGDACHLTNAEQLAVAIESLFHDLILPIALTGLPVDIIGLGGNHDREQSERFTVDPGRHYYTYTIYYALKLLAKASGLNNVKFDIPSGPYAVYEVFGHHFLLEHGDLLGSNINTNKLESQLLQRSAQVGKILKGIRIGHFHNDLIGNIGRHIINPSVVSDDHFGDGLGFVSRPGQIINFYVNTNERDTSYYHSFVVNLE